MQTRSDKLIDSNSDEAEYRLGDNGNDVKEKADFVIDNSLDHQDNSFEKVRKIVKEILKHQ